MSSSKQTALAQARAALLYMQRYCNPPSFLSTKAAGYSYYKSKSLTFSTIFGTNTLSDDEILVGWFWLTKDAGGSEWWWSILAYFGNIWFRTFSTIICKHATRWWNIGRMILINGRCMRFGVMRKLLPLRHRQFSSLLVQEWQHWRLTHSLPPKAYRS
jgi:hypothetical protein